MDLVSKRNIMERTEFEKKGRSLNEKHQAHQDERRKWFDGITVKRNNARAEVLEFLDPILTEHFEQNQISIMLYRRSMVIGSSELDITDTIIDELNKKLPSIKFN